MRVCSALCVGSSSQGLMRFIVCSFLLGHAVLRKIPVLTSIYSSLVDNLRVLHETVRFLLSRVVCDVLCVGLDAVWTVTPCSSLAAYV